MKLSLYAALRAQYRDVIIDIRPSSPTYRRWQAFELSESNGTQLYVPKGFAHGFQTISADAEVNYLISEPYTATAAFGIRYDDATFAIAWPLPVSAVSDKDARWPNFRRLNQPRQIRCVYYDRTVSFQKVQYLHS